jgi:hypothetical protein
LLRRFGSQYELKRQKKKKKERERKKKEDKKRYIDCPDFRVCADKRL